METATKAIKIRVLVVDDHPMVREGVSASVSSQPDMEIVGEAASAEEALATFPSIRPDITLMDLRLPEMSGVDAIARLHHSYPGARIIVLTTYQGGRPGTSRIQGWGYGVPAQEFVTS